MIKNPRVLTGSYLMKTDIFSFLLAALSLALTAVSPAYAQEVLPPDAGGQPNFMSGLLNAAQLALMCYLVYWFLVVRPQDKKANEHKALVQGLKKGDSVIMTSGIVGRVSGLEEGFVSLEIAPNVRVKVEKSHIARLEKNETKAAA